MQLSTTALLSGNFVAQDVELKSPTVRLAIGKDGKGNWEGLLPALKGDSTTSNGTSAAGLALSTVHIVHGAVELVGAAEGQQWRFEDVNGEVDAAGPQGPFRFKGAYQQDGKPAELRLSVGRDDAAGKLRLKASTHAADASVASYTFDGVIETLDGQTSLAGDLEGKLPFPASATNTQAAVGGGLDLKTKIVASNERAKLTEIEIVLDSPGRPQRLTGSAVVSFNSDAASEAVLKSAWLDLDQVAGRALGAAITKPASKATLRGSLQGLFALAGGAPSLAGKGHLRLVVEESVFGGGPVNGLQMSINRTGNGLTVESLSAKLPGQSLLSASGEVNTLGSPHFDGQVRLWGTNLAAMTNWALPSMMLKELTSASPYLIDTEVAVDAARFSAEKLRAEVSGTTLTGGIRYVAAPQSLSITLDSNRLDLAREFDVPIGLATLAGFTGSAPEPNTEPGSAAGLDLKSFLAGDTFLDLRIGRLITAQGALHDVSAKLDRSNGRLNIPSIDVATDDGFTLHVEGALQVKDDQGQGQLRLLIGAPSSKAVLSALRIAGLTESVAGADKLFAALTPLSLAGTVELGGKSSTSESLALDGSAASSRLRLLLRRDAGESDWHSGQLEAAAELGNPDAERLLEQIARSLGRSLAPSAPDVAGAAVAPPLPGMLSLRLSGIPEDGLATRLGLTTGVLDASFDGRASFGSDLALVADGSIAINAKDANRAVRLSGLSGMIPDQPGELKLTGRLHRDNTLLALTNASVTTAGTQSTGDIKLLNQLPRPRLEANLQSTSLRIDRWLSLLAPAVGSTVATRDAADGSPWPDQSFDFKLTETLDTRISAGAKQLVLANGLSLDNARLSADTHPGKLDLRLQEGHALQGDWSGRAVLEKAPAGAALHLEATLDKARLDQIGGAQSAVPRPEGELALHLSLDGRGLTPRDVVSSASGKGDFSLSEGAFAGFSSNTVDAVARISLADSAALSAEAVSHRLAETSKTGAFAFRGAKGSLSIADGAIRLDKMLVDSAQSQLEIANRIDLTKLQLASTWRLQPKPVQSGKVPLPPIQFGYQGNLSDLGLVQPVIEFADLQRELEARKQLGEPEQSQGIWPVETAAAPGVRRGINANSASPDPDQHRAICIDGKVRCTACHWGGCGPGSDWTSYRKSDCNRHCHPCQRRRGSQSRYQTANTPPAAQEEGRLGRFISSRLVWKLTSAGRDAGRDNETLARVMKNGGSHREPPFCRIEPPALAAAMPCLLAIESQLADQQIVLLVALVNLVVGIDDDVDLALADQTATGLDLALTDMHVGREDLFGRQRVRDQLVILHIEHFRDVDRNDRLDDQALSAILAVVANTNGAADKFVVHAAAANRHFGLVRQNHDIGAGRRRGDHDRRDDLRRNIFLDHFFLHCGRCIACNHRH